MTMKKADKATKRTGRDLTFKTMPVGVFKTNLSEMIDEVQAKSESIIITKRGSPVVKLVLRGKGNIIGDVVSPVLAAEE